MSSLWLISPQASIIYTDIWLNKKEAFENDIIRNTEVDQNVLTPSNQIAKKDTGNMK